MHGYNGILPGAQVQTSTRLSEWLCALAVLPAARVTGSVISVLLSALFSASLAIQIILEGGLIKTWFYMIVNFFVMPMSILLMIFYLRYLYLYDSSTRNFLDVEYCKAYMRRACLPEMAKKYQQMIKECSDPAQIRNLFAETEDLLK